VWDEIREKESPTGYLPISRVSRANLKADCHDWPPSTNAYVA